MKTAVGIAVGAAILVAAVFLLRSAPDPVPRERPPAPRNEKTSPASELAPSTELSPLPPDPPVKSFDARSILSDLARALRNGDLDAARAILRDLRDELLPPVPDEENAAILYAEALPLLDIENPKGEAEKAYSAILDGRAPDPETLAHLRAWLQEHSEALAEGTRLLREAADRPHCRFAPNPETGMGPPAASLLQMQKACNVLAVQTYLGHLDGRSVEAGENVRAAWRLSRGARSTPNFLNQMIGIALEGIVFNSLPREGFIRGPEVASVVSGIDPSYGEEAWRRSILGEVYYAGSQLLRHDGDPTQARELPVYIESMAEVLELPPARHAEWKLKLEALARKYGENSPFTLPQMTIPTLPGIKRTMIMSDVRGAVLQVALEVERYRARRGAYPQTLDALGVALPVDPLTGGSLDYRFDGSQVLIQTASDFRDKRSTVWRSGPVPPESPK